MPRWRAARADRTVVFGVRPEDVLDVSVATAGASPSAPCVEASVDVAEPLGAETLLHLTSGTHAVIARVPPAARYAPGRRVPVAFKLAQSHLFDAETELAL